MFDEENKNSPNTIVAPITHSSSRLPIVSPISNKHDSNGNLILDGFALLGNVVCVSKARLGDFVVKLDSSDMDAVDKALAISLDLKHHYDKLKNIHNDKLEYIEKLKGKITKLEDSITEKDDVLNRLVMLQNELGVKDFDSLEEKIREKISE